MHGLQPIIQTLNQRKGGGSSATNVSNANSVVIMRAMVDVFPGAATEAVAEKTKLAAAVFKKTDIYHGVASALSIGLDEALFRKDSALINDAQWQRMGSTRGRTKADSLRIYPSLNRIRELRKMMNQELSSRFNVVDTEDAWCEGGRANIALFNAVMLLLLREIAENGGAPLSTETAYEFKLSADGAGMTKDGRGLLMFYLIPLFARWPGLKSHQSAKACWPLAIGMAKETKESLRGFLGQNFETVLQGLRAEGVPFRFPDGTSKKVSVKFTFVSDMSALVKLIDGIGSVTAQHSCHLCHETKQEREDFTRSRSAWPEPRTIYGMGMQNVAICSLHGNLRITETLIKLTFELIVSLLFPTEPLQALSAANEGGVDDEDAKDIQTAKSKPQSRSPSCFVPSI